MRGLSSKKKLFVEAYCGDPVEAMRIAGFTGTNASLRAGGNKLLSDPDIMEAIKDRSKYLNKTANVIASRESRMELWTDIMNNNDPHWKETNDANGIPIKEGNIPMNYRLKASELLGKAEGDFIERLDISGNVTISDVIMESYKVEDKSIDVIEAEYMLIRESRKQDAKVADEDEGDANVKEDVADPSSCVDSLEDLI